MRKFAGAVALSLGCSFILLAVAHGQGRGGGAWSTAGGDEQLTGWQKSESQLTRDTVKNMKFLWKIKLGSQPVTEPTEPLFGGHTITNYGFKDIAAVLGPANTLTSVDYELGTVLWQRKVTPPPHAGLPCPSGQFASFVIQPAPTFGFGRGRGAAGRGAAGRGAAGRGSAPAGPPPEPPTPEAPRVGAAGGGFGGIRGIFVLTPDGQVHEQLLTNGWDYGTPVKFLAPDSNMGFPTDHDGTLYVNTSGSCGGAPNGVFSLDMSTAEYQKASYKSGDVGVTGTDGGALSTDGKTLYATTGSGAANGAAHPNSVLALDAKTLELKDYYTPSGGEAAAKADINVSPVAFSYKGKDYVAAYVAGGRLALLDAESLGGSNHRTPLAITPALSKNGGVGAWGRLASAEDAGGTRFIYVSVNGPLAADAKLPMANGSVTDGAVVAFKVEGEGSALKLTPAWVSPNVADPSPASIVMNAAPPNVDNFGQPLGAAPSVVTPVKLGGIVFTLAEGEPGKSHARLYGFDAETGAQIYSSADEIASAANQASISISGGHVLFVTADNTLYAFGVQYVRD
jgi:hypothetical protein